MAEKELRRMNRTELIEIIYALQQNGMTLQQENEELHRQLDDKTIRIENAGSIAEAALSLNRIFEDAEAAAQQYLDSVRAVCDPIPSQADETTAPQQECDRLLEETQQKCDQMLKEARQECDRMREQALCQARDKIDSVNREIRLLLGKYPMLEEYMKKEFGKEAEDGAEL